MSERLKPSGKALGEREKVDGAWTYSSLLRDHTPFFGCTACDIWEGDFTSHHEAWRAKRSHTASPEHRHMLKLVLAARHDARR
jgi:hypothetical protein